MHQLVQIFSSNRPTEVLNKSYIAPRKFNRKGARVVEWGGLENRCPREWTQGSNPCLSAGTMCQKG